MGWQDAPEVDGGSWQSAPVIDKSIFAKGPLKIGKDAFGDTFREELKAQPWGIQQIVGAGTALGNLVEGAKQFAFKGNEQNIEANKIMEQNAPVASFIGNASLAAVPFGIAGNSLKAAGAVGAGLGILNPVEGDQSKENVIKGKAINTTLGGVTGVAGQAIANKAGQYISNKLQGIQEARIRNAPLDKTIQDAMDAGLVVPPSSVNPSFLNTLKEGVSGKIATAQVASNRNAPVIDALARQAVGLPENAPLTSEAMQAIRKQAYQQGYEPIASIGRIPTDKQYAQALDNITKKYNGVADDFPGAVPDDIPKLVGYFNKADFDAGNAIKAVQFLRDTAAEDFRKGNTGIAKAAKDIAGALEDQIERNLSQVTNGAQTLHPYFDKYGTQAYGTGQDLLQNFRDARQLMAKAHTVEDAIVEGGGSINAKKLAARAQAGKPLSGELETIGKFANNFPKATQPAMQVGGPGVSKLTHLAALGMGAGGAAAGGPVGAIAAAAAMEGLPYALRARMLSKAAQQAAAESRYAPRLDSKLARLLQNSQVGGTVLGLETLGQ